MSDTNNQSGNRWEKPDDANAEAAEPVETPTPDPDVEPVETPTASAPVSVPSDATYAAPVEKKSKLPAWVTGRRVAAAGAAAAIFVGGGGIGYAIGASGHDDRRDFPGRFDRTGFQPGQGQFPGGQMPGNGRGPDFQQGPPGQSQDQSQGQSSGGSSSGTDSGADSGAGSGTTTS